MDDVISLEALLLAFKNVWALEEEGDSGGFRLVPKGTRNFFEDVVKSYWWLVSVSVITSAF